MNTKAFRFEFERSVSLTEAERTLHLAAFAAEGLFGAAVVRLELKYQVNERADTIIVDGDSDVGVAVARVYTALLLHEFGQDAFRVRPVEAAQAEAVTAPV